MNKIELIGDKVILELKTYTDLVRKINDLEEVIKNDNKCIIYKEIKYDNYLKTFEIEITNKDEAVEELKVALKQWNSIVSHLVDLYGKVDKDKYKKITKILEND